VTRKSIICFLFVLQFITDVATNMVKLHKKTPDPDEKEIAKVVKAFADRRNEHKLFGKEWKKYLNDPLCIWMFDYMKVWTAYSTGYKK